MGVDSSPHVVVGVPSSDPPNEDHVEARSGTGTDTIVDRVETRSGTADTIVGTGLDPLEALEALETPKTMVDPVAHEEKTEKIAPSSRDFLRGGAEQDVSLVGGAKRPQDFGATLVHGSFNDKDDEPEAPLNSSRGKFSATLALGSLNDAKDAKLPEPPESSPDVKSEDTKRVANEPIQPVKVEEPPLPPPKRVASEESEESKEVAESKAQSKSKDKTDKTEKKGGKSESVPPVDVGAVDEKFFSEGDVAVHLNQAEAIEGGALTVPDKAKRKSDPQVVERRARFVRYVKWAVAGAAVVCVAALARTAVMSSKPADPSTVRNVSRPTFGGSATTTESKPTESKPAEPKAATPAVAPIPSTDTPAASASAAPAPSESATPPTATAPSADTPAPAASAEAKPEVGSGSHPEEATGDAKEEKKKAVSFLEKRKLADAIEAGERSVKLDPTDGEAWLILGAAYQEKGNLVDARRAYASCVKEATTGPRHECGKMLR